MGLNKALSDLSQLPLQTITRSFKEVRFIIDDIHLHDEALQIESDLLIIGGYLSLVGCIGMDQKTEVSTSDDK